MHRSRAPRSGCRTRSRRRELHRIGAHATRRRASRDRTTATRRRGKARIVWCRRPDSKRSPDAVRPRLMTSQPMNFASPASSIALRIVARAPSNRIVSCGSHSTRAPRPDAQPRCRMRPHAPSNGTTSKHPASSPAHARARPRRYRSPANLRRRSLRAGARLSPGTRRRPRDRAASARAADRHACARRASCAGPARSKVRSRRALQPVTAESSIGASLRRAQVRPWPESSACGTDQPRSPFSATACA